MHTQYIIEEVTKLQVNNEKLKERNKELQEGLLESIETLKELIEEVEFQDEVIRKFTLDKKLNARPMAKLTEEQAKTIYLLTHTTDLTNRELVSFVKIYYGIEVVPSCISNIRTGYNWGNVTDGLIK